jgi:hypothetical protein
MSAERGRMVPAMTPGANPVGALADRMAAFDGADVPALSARLRADPEQADAAVRRAARLSGAPPGARLILVIDQFEEVFTVAAASPCGRCRRAD